jgi:hypothetical protein
MAQKKKVFSKVKAVKDAARATVGTPRSGRAIPDDKMKAEQRGEKHKKKLAELMEAEQ